MKPAAIRALSLILAMGLGLFFPQASAATAYVKYLTMAMLVCSFVGIHFDWREITWRHFAILGAIFGISTLAYASLLPLGGAYAQLAWIIAITPTAVAAPAVTAMLGGRVEFVAVSVILTHLGVGLNLPWLIAVFGHVNGMHPSVSQILGPTLQVILLPLIIAFGLQRLPAKIFEPLKNLKSLSFPIWLSILFIAAANGRHFFITHPEISSTMALEIFAIAAVLCAINFWVGRLIGGKSRTIEASQALGQKNTALTLWVSLSYISPLVALGPMMYILCHNLYNSYQLYRAEEKAR